MISTMPRIVQSMIRRTMPRMMRKAPMVTAVSLPARADASNVRPMASRPLEPRTPVRRRADVVRADAAPVILIDPYVGVVFGRVLDLILRRAHIDGLRLG